MQRLAARRLAGSRHRGEDEHRILQGGDAVTMAAETTELPRPKRQRVIAGNHRDRSGQDEDARGRWRIVLPQFRTADHGDQGLPERAVVDEDVGTSTVRVSVSESEMLRRQIFQVGIGVDHCRHSLRSAPALHQR